ncbi:hypothetical protein C8Q80DRAFT_737802 [Daedaleopsis nitida]|nr:hypothetical protein C8Q80DRAFT_737802 [Daedaleopsis nitida]
MARNILGFNGVQSETPLIGRVRHLGHSTASRSTPVCSRAFWSMPRGTNAPVHNMHGACNMLLISRAGQEARWLHGRLETGGMNCTARNGTHEIVYGRRRISTPMTAVRKSCIFLFQYTAMEVAKIAPAPQGSTQVATRVAILGERVASPGASGPYSPETCSRARSTSTATCGCMRAPRRIERSHGLFFIIPFRHLNAPCQQFCGSPAMLGPTVSSSTFRTRDAPLSAACGTARCASGLDYLLPRVL